MKQGVKIFAKLSPGTIDKLCLYQEYIIFGILYTLAYTISLCIIIKALRVSLGPAIDGLSVLRTYGPAARMASQLAVSVKDVYKKYGRGKKAKHVLKGLNMEVPYNTM